jgi:hypothetical protein
MGCGGEICKQWQRGTLSLALSIYASPPPPPPHPQWAYLLIVYNNISSVHISLSSVQIVLDNACFCFHVLSQATSPPQSTLTLL